MKSPVFISVSLSLVLLSIVIVSCTSTPNLPIQLASFSENDVSVAISLNNTSAGHYFLSATFTPPDGYHLYSKDIPVHGINGVGRPTLLELIAESQTKALGGLADNVPPEKFYFEHNEFQVYPLGAVTLSLPVELPPGHRWVSDKLKITFMACSSTLCKAPVEGKIVTIRVPGAELFDNQ